MRFPDGFLWGAATAAHQIEGNNVNSDWWRARGLTSTQIDLLKKKFAPTDTATRALKDDYQKWAGGGGS